MGYLSELLGMKTLELSKVSSEPRGVSIKTTPKIVRIDPAELEQTYVSDPFCFNSINKSTQMIMAAGYELVDDVGSYYENFFANIGDVGEDITFNDGRTPALILRPLLSSN